MMKSEHNIYADANRLPFCYERLPMRVLNDDFDYDDDDDDDDGTKTTQRLEITGEKQK